ncbi:HTH-type transcriptional regulator KmtR [Oceanobacillus picturae]|jgi:DNA-binding transcriptional ArsR family regulator|uniref:HTH-type transcriptional regulator KmtR n=2 Tax=Oceanobacillus TaxID=182709 RepID=W9ANY7_9BACI|nr:MULTISPECIES: metalloregulator ArsR/SmtB family transcription factor [Oceanobacillus]AVQ98194.1 transcriptional regulator [Oceanobacillus iheyensis]MCG3419847.1 metalloregulator ArsR/SmtB family transcription factor [Oceanobacillus jordanicus]RIU91371.1 ArsR family transcriptional regulator [Oceanobacillus picturae]CDO04361.1 HTH-type transcriptional regulator KmtR [Oceanobacillus picturae]GAQ17294.1 HTH-type transcriptional regulator KmtR [Oceanobacillus picturae]
MLQVDIDTKMKFLHGLSNKTRVQILESIKEDEKTVSQIVQDLNGNQSNISQHLTCLKGCGLVVGRQDGKYVYYRVRNQLVRDLLTMIDVVLEDVEKDVACCDSHID